MKRNHTLVSSTSSAQPASFLETLEGRQLLSVSVNNGWTDVNAAGDSRVIHVSSTSGADGNNGSLNSPVKSLERAKSMIRDHSVPRR